MRKMLITGAGGFIGGNLINAFRDDYEITAVYRNHLRNRLEGIKYIRFDFSSDVERCLDEFTDYYHVILHFAGQVHNSLAVDYIDNSLISTRNIIELAKKSENTLLIYASSNSSYGYSDVEVNENSDRLNPTLYGMSKTFCEKMIEESGVNYVNIRLPRILGREMDYSFPWLPMLANRLHSNECIRYYNPQLMYNNLLDINDLVAFIRIIFEKKTRLCWTVSLGCADKMSVLDIILLLRDCMNSKSDLKEIERKPNTVFAVDISKAKSVGFSPMTVGETINLLAGYALEDLNK